MGNETKRSNTISKPPERKGNYTGLDMYLNRKKYVKQWDENAKPLNIHIPGVDPNKVVYIEEKCMYWRKDNAIHKWFVDNCQDGIDDCRTAWVAVDQLKELLKVITQCLNDKEGKAKKLLPTTSGFFFGGTEYDEYYWAGLKKTKTKLEEILKGDNNHWEYYYHSSW